MLTIQYTRNYTCLKIQKFSISVYRFKNGDVFFLGLVLPRQRVPFELQHALDEVLGLEDGKVFWL